eukprot:s62_g9.t1
MVSGQADDSSIKLEVSLPSGRCETISLLRWGTVEDLKIAAQQSLGQRFLRLAAPDGRLLDPTDPLQLSGLQEGDSLTAIAQQPKLAATRRAFALWCVEGDGIVTWGDPNQGGDSSRVQDHLRNVQQICGTGTAFAAILADGSVVTWGDSNHGGDSFRVQDQLRNVQQICGTFLAFAAILADGSVVTWGNRYHGGDTFGVQDQLRNVKQICRTDTAFAAILADGSVVTWGHPHQGGDSSRVQDQLRNVEQICGSDSAFAAILTDGSVVTWGDSHHGGDTFGVQDQLRTVQQICGTRSAFAAILAEESVVTWGHPHQGGDSSRVQHQLRNVQQICGTDWAFAAILADGTVVTGAIQNLAVTAPENVRQICGTGTAFAAILAHGSVVTWGHPEFGGDSFRVLLCKEPQATGPSQLPPAHLYEGDPEGQLPLSTATEVKAVGSQRVLQIMAYLLRRIPQCGEFFAKPLQQESWLEGDAQLVGGGQLSDLVGRYSVNVLLRLLTTTLYLASSRHAEGTSELDYQVGYPTLHPDKEKTGTEGKEPSQAAPAAGTAGTGTAPSATAATATTATAAAGAAGGTENQAESPSSAEQQSLERRLDPEFFRALPWEKRWEMRRTMSSSMGKSLNYS